MDTTNRIESGLRPRAIAVLCALRQRPLTTLQLKNAIGDSSVEDTHALVCDMLTDTIDHAGLGDKRWYLTHDGVGWLETNGLTAAREARLWVAREEQGK